MKKKVIALLVAVMVLAFTTGCSNATNTDVEAVPTEESTSPCLLLEGESTTDLPIEEPELKSAENLELHFTSTGKYTMSGFGEEFSIYRFNSPNDDIVIYQISSSIYVVGEDAGETGNCYGIIRMISGEFIALSNNYLLFQTNTGKVAVEIDRRRADSLTKGSGEKHLFRDLSEMEQTSFVCPIVQEKVSQ